MSLNCALLNGWCNKLYAIDILKPLASSPQHGHERRARELAACTGELKSAAKDQGGQDSSLPKHAWLSWFLFVKCEFPEGAELWWLLPPLGEHAHTVQMISYFSWPELWFLSISVDVRVAGTKRAAFKQQTEPISRRFLPIPSKDKAYELVGGLISFHLHGQATPFACISSYLDSWPPYRGSQGAYFFSPHPVWSLQKVQHNLIINCTRLQLALLAAEPMPWGCTVLSTVSLKASKPQKTEVVLAPYCWAQPQANSWGSQVNGTFHDLTTK